MHRVVLHGAWTVLQYCHRRMHRGRLPRQLVRQLWWHCNHRLAGWALLSFTHGHWRLLPSFLPRHPCSATCAKASVTATAATCGTCRAGSSCKQQRETQLTVLAVHAGTQSKRIQTRVSRVCLAVCPSGLSCPAGATCCGSACCGTGSICCNNKCTVGSQCPPSNRCNVHWFGAGLTTTTCTQCDPQCQVRGSRMTGFL